jgi:hypothetical protein
MHLCAMLTIGDCTVTLTKVSGGSTTESRYRMNISDIFSGSCTEHEIVGENEAILTLAAWMAADETGADIEARIKSLYDIPAFKGQLP